MADVPAILKNNVGTIAAGVGGIIGGGVLGAVAVSAYNRSKSRKRRKSSSKNTRKRSNLHKRKRYRKTPRTAGKGKDRSTRRIRYTKNGQPYVKLKNGKCRFIKKKSARTSHKKSGGRY